MNDGNYTLGLIFVSSWFQNNVSSLIILFNYKSTRLTS